MGRQKIEILTSATDVLSDADELNSEIAGFAPAPKKSKIKQADSATASQ